MPSRRRLERRFWLPGCASLLCLSLSLVASPARPATPLLFRDGFETGTTCRWVPDASADFTLQTLVDARNSLTAAAQCGTFESFAQRDAAGLVTGVDGWAADLPWGEVVHAELDAGGRPIRFFLEPSGARIDLEWTGANSFVMTMLSGGGSTQVSTAVVLPAAPPKDFPPSVQPGPRPLATALDATVGLTGTVHLDHCGVPSNDLLVEVSVSDPFGNVQRASCVPTALPGECSYSISSPTSLPGVLTDMCASIADQAGNICDWLVDPVSEPQAAQGVCAAAAAAIDLLTIPSGEAIALYGICLTAFEGAELYCGTIGGGAAPGAPSPIDVICPGIAATGYPWVGDQVTVMARAYTDTGVEVRSSTGPAAGPLPSFLIQTSGTPSVDSLAISPIDPAPGQSYLANAAIQCVQGSSQVTVSIFGSDGYSDSTDCSLTGNGSCTLAVPGGAAGVSDRIEVAIDGVVERVTGLVF